MCESSPIRRWFYLFGQEMEAMELVRRDVLGMYAETGLIEFTDRLCVGCEGKRGIKGDSKTLWSDQREE